MHTTSFVAAVHISAVVSAPDFASVSPCCSILLLYYIQLSLSSTSHIYVLDIVGPLHFLLTLLTNFLIMFARWHISLSAYFYIVRASADGFLELYAVSVDGMGSFSRIHLHLSVEQKVSAQGHLPNNLPWSPLAVTIIRYSKDK